MVSVGQGENAHAIAEKMLKSMELQAQPFGLRPQVLPLDSWEARLEPVTTMFLYKKHQKEMENHHVSWEKRRYLWAMFNSKPEAICLVQQEQPPVGSTGSMLHPQ